MFTIISDIDDVIRDFRKNVEYAMGLYYKGDDWGEYYYNNEKIQEFFSWFYKQSWFYKLYDSNYANIEIVSLYTDILLKNNAELYFLSSNSDIVGQHLTSVFIQTLFPDKDLTKNIFYVDRWYNKIEFIEENMKKLNIDSKNTIFIDDRPDSCLHFEKVGIKSFWYTTYMSNEAIKMWIDGDKNIKKLNKGKTIELIKFIQTSYGEIHV